MENSFERSPFCNEQDHTKTIEYKRLEPKDIYSLYDARARDYRTILIAILGAEIALLSQFVISLYEKRMAAVVTYAVLMIVLWCIARFVIAPEVNEVVNQSRELRVRYIKNRNAVPQIDSLLIGKRIPLVLDIMGVRRITREDETSPEQLRDRS